MSGLVLYVSVKYHCKVFIVFFFQAEDGIRDLVRSRGLGDVYKRQLSIPCAANKSWVKFICIFKNESKGSAFRKRSAYKLSLIHI